MEAIQHIGNFYIQGSLVCSLLAYAIVFCKAGFSKREGLPKLLMVADRMIMIILLAFSFSVIGFGVGIVCLAKMQVPNSISLNNEVFGQLGIRAGALLGVTWGWLYGDGSMHSGL